MDINLLNGNVHRYKKESCSATSSFWLAQDASSKTGRSRWASVARSVPSNPSLDSLDGLDRLDYLEDHTTPFYSTLLNPTPNKKRLPNY